MNDQSKSAAVGHTTRPKVVIERTYRAKVGELWELWTTKQGFESWWGPDGFRVEVHALEARLGGTLHYDMIADSPEMIAVMKQMGRPTSSEARARFTEIRLHERLAITSVIDRHERTTAVTPAPASSAPLLRRSPITAADRDSLQMKNRLIGSSRPLTT